MYIDVVPNRNSPAAVLLRETHREGARTVKKTIANLSHWPAAKVEALRAVLRDEALVRREEAFAIEQSLPHGHVAAVLEMARRIGLETILGSKPSPQRDLVLAMIVERVLEPCSKLATTRVWLESTLAEELKVQDASVNQLYEALDWLLARQERIEAKLASLHLREGGQVLYDVSSSYYEGHTCPLAHLGHSRDDKRGLPIIVYGVLTDTEGRPVAVEVYPGNTGDPTTVPDQVEKLRMRFGLERVVLVGDRGMLTSARIAALRAHPALGWISALRASEIQKLAAQGAVQLSLFDEQNLAEIRCAEAFPGERLVACFNPLLAEQRARKREELLQATEKALEKIQKEAARRTQKLLTDQQIALKAGAVAGRHKMRKHFIFTIEAGQFHYARNEETITHEAALDGIYIVRTSEPEERLSAPDTVRHYKRLAQVERAFRTLKSIDLRIRPIHHRTEDHVRAHILLCLLAYCLEWHLRKAWAPLLFDDEQLDAERARRDPVAPAQISAQTRRKKAERQTDEGLPVQSFHTLLKHLATLCRNRCRLKNDPQSPAWQQLTDPTPLQAKAFALLKQEVCPVRGR